MYRSSVIVIALFLAACGGDSPGGTFDASGDRGAPTSDASRSVDDAATRLVDSAPTPRVDAARTSDATKKPPCADRCTLGGRQCAGPGYQVCAKAASGCAEWGAIVACKAGQICSGGACVAQCTNQCTLGAKRCAAAGVQSCARMASGCTDWAKPVGCPTGQVCSGGLCVKRCVDRCTAGTKQCSGTGFALCTKLATGCLDWGTPTPCAVGHFCSGGACVKRCTNQCTLGAKRCSGSGAQSCTTMSSGCTDWSTIVPCKAGEYCASGTCKRGCVNTCVAGQRGCGATGTRVCTLSAGCWVWGKDTSCATGTRCVDGRCAAGATTITKTTELCGEQTYTGAFIVQGGAKVTCNTGALTIRAPTIFVDPSSSIEISPTWTRGSGPSARNCWYYWTYTSAGAAGGGYGTAGKRGGSVGFYSPCRSCGSLGSGPAFGSAYDDTVDHGGRGGSGCELAYRAACNLGRPAAGKGGGTLRLFGATSVTIYGKLLARGGAGASSTREYRSAGAGGGSGGGVLLRAPKLELSNTALVSTAGGAGGVGSKNRCSGDASAFGGAGGLGRVKLIYGDSYANKAKIDGVTSTARMPPAAITSSTHPDPTRHYNDGFATLALAWTKPYAGAIGYWYRLDRAPLTQLTPTNGAYTTGLAKGYPAASVVGAGDHYFHLLSVHKDSKASTVATRLRVRINAAPHTLTSTSHPDPKTWVSDPTKRTVVLKWAPPKVTTAASFQAAWYRVDHVTNTAAPVRGATSGWTRVAGPAVQAVVTKDHLSRALTDGTYYFHVVSEDTRRNLTKAAAHYRVQLGKAPKKTNLYGYVTHRTTGAKVAAATVMLQPYAQTATTDSNGYFIIKDVYEGSYALTATKSGLTTVRVQVKVTPAASPYRFTML